MHSALVMKKPLCHHSASQLPLHQHLTILGAPRCCSSLLCCGWGKLFSPAQATVPQYESRFHYSKGLPCICYFLLLFVIQFPSGYGRLLFLPGNGDWAGSWFSWELPAAWLSALTTRRCYFILTVWSQNRSAKKFLVLQVETSRFSGWI